MAQRDYYEILQIERTVSGEEIKKAYRSLAMKYHPDRNPDNPEAEAKFKEAAEAYDILRDDQKRQQYDHFGHAGVQGGRGFSSSSDVFSNFGDIFGDFFGFSAGAGARSRPRAGTNLRYDLKISFRQAVLGDDVAIKIPRNATCPDCKGSGCETGTDKETCPQCAGAGQIRHNQGFFQVSVPCPACRGAGSIITKPCKRCRGEAVIQEVRELSVHIPAGVDSGNRLRLRGEGESGINSGPAGDLFIVLHVEDDDIFERDGQDLILTRTVTFIQAALGDKIDVPTLGEPITVDVPKGTQSGEVFRIPEKGIPFPGRKKNGSLLVEIKVQTPVNLNEKQEDLLREFARLEFEKPMAKAKKIFKKVGKAMGLD